MQNFYCVEARIHREIDKRVTAACCRGCRIDTWGEDGVEPGDLLRVGERLVILLQDRGIAGTLDYDDLCFDFFRGASVRPLREVFVGDGLVEWTSFS